MLCNTDAGPGLVLEELEGLMVPGGVTVTVEVAVVINDGIVMPEKVKEPDPKVTTVDV